MRITGLLSMLAISLLRVISKLPLPVLYGMGSVVTFVLRYVVRYRYTVITDNLNRAFPNETPKKIKVLRANYYQYIGELIAETLWAVNCKPEDLNARMQFETMDLYAQSFNRNEHIMVLMGHVGNWEWAGLAMSLSGYHHLHAVYKPLSNTAFDSFFKTIRARFGAALIPMHQIGRDFLSASEHPRCFAFIADQSPDPKTADWVAFLNRPTPFFNGYARLAQKRDMPVFFVWCERVKKGRYVIHTDLITLHSTQLSTQQLVSVFAQNLESSIHMQPHTWLWSHRRWKHSPNA